MTLITASIDVGKDPSPEDLLAALKWESNALVEVLVGDVTRFNLRADYSSESLILKEVQKSSPRYHYTLRYSFGWEAYWGCRDLNDGDIVSEEIEFTYKAGSALFAREVVEKRSTRDEF